MIHYTKYNSWYKFIPEITKGTYVRTITEKRRSIYKRWNNNCQSVSYIVDCTIYFADISYNSENNDKSVSESDETHSCRYKPNEGTCSNDTQGSWTSACQWNN